MDPDGRESQLAAASIAGSFLGVTKGTIDTLAVLALVAYLMSVGTAVYTLLPHRIVCQRGRSSSSHATLT
jgi:hypothetical protein